MALYVDKYRPKELDSFDFHDNISKQLIQLSNSDDIPHLLIYGPSGAGKKTRISALLKALFGSGTEKLKVDQRQFKTNNDRKLDITILSSNFHIEMTPSDVGIYDRIVVQEVIKEIAQTRQLDAQARHQFKVVIINEADSLSREAQQGLRRTMEKYMGNLRLILVCSSTSKIISPVRSRCLLVRIPLPKENEVCDVLQKVAKSEKIILPNILAHRIADMSGGNMRKALLVMEATKVRQYPFHDQQELEMADWEKYISDIATKLVKDEPSPDKLLQIRANFYELLTHCIPPSTIIKTLTFELLRRVTENLKTEIVQQAAIYEYRIQTGSKAIFHLEAFVAKCMSLFKQQSMQML